jgi:predicted ferric reductase
MTDQVQANQSGEPTYTSAGPVLALMIAGSLGVLAALIVVPSWSPGLTATLLGSSPKAYWYLSRATAFVALGLLWLSMVMGLLISDKIARAWPGAQAAFSMHEYVSLLGLGFAAFHALILLGDRYIGYDLRQVLLPFASEGYRPVWIGLGQLGLYVWALVAATFYIRQRIGHKAWRFIHFASYFNFTVVILHGLASGTDTGSPWAQAAYWLFGGSVFFLTAYRIVASLSGPEKPAAAPATRPAASPQ